MPVQQSFCLPCYYNPEEDLAAFLKEAKNIGFPAVEIWHRDMLDDFDGFCETAHSLGFTIPSMAGHNGIESGLNDYEQHERIETELRASIDSAVEKNVKTLICFGGERLAGQSDYDAMIACAAGIRRVLPYAEEKGVILNMELLNSKIDHFNYVCDHFDWGFALAELIDSPCFKLLFDIYHMQIMDGDIIRNIKRGIHRIGHFHTAGHPGRHDLDDLQEIHYPGICNAIAATPYQGYIGHEFWTRGDDKLQALAAAFAVCNVQ